MSHVASRYAPLRAVAVWVLLLAIAAIPALRVGDVLRGGSDAVPGSESIEAVDRAVDAGWPAGTFYPFVAVLHSGTHKVTDPAFAEAARALSAALLNRGAATAVHSAWSTGDATLLGKSGHTALLLIRPDAASFAAAELATPALREAIASVALPAGFQCELTGQPAVMHDLNRRSSSDLLAAERIGLPLALLVLLLVFRSPVAALLPIALALTAATISLAVLYFLSGVTVVSLFAQNTVTMIGLGVGVDYALLLVGEFRYWLAAGLPASGAARRATQRVRGTIVISGMAVAVGFLALCLVRLPFLRALAFGGVVVVMAAVAATLTLLPALLALLGERVNWPRRRVPDRRPSPFWNGWARQVMRRPLLWTGLAMLVLAGLVLPVLRMQGWNLGASGLPPDLEARHGYDALQADFAPGWIGPTVVAIEAPEGSVDEAGRQAITRLVMHLQGDARVAQAGLMAEPGVAAERMTLLLVVGHEPPESQQAAALVHELRGAAAGELAQVGLTMRVTGAPAMLVDFDAEIFSRLWLVVPAVLALTFLVLMWHLRSVLIPVKAILLNLLSVLASYGFLVLVFQDGHGAGLLGLDPPGGLNAFVVLLLFTVLFGLSMDYEVFLLSRMRAEYLRTGSNADAIANGIARTGGIVTSAAAIMIVLFLAFGFTPLVATREFGLGLAFAVALDATLVRLVLVPALMTLLGRANWWWPALWRYRRLPV